ncbi:GTP:adenosylcobinamide-phosphate guanylyltransferase [Nitrosomonas aestuarii]|uniref:GTP:adenosylcobinamide-phosphate guanylyltransferase n=1 Tax=Nitrosomonas aestuarii TaxID=52441 RepID=A0A1I4E1M9_9PROT|nr:nucleotidyltransferase family protein [Nitrosomonas aestuarii]SFK99734.1 GTP:adenosylcobinamide-phosphate guanylyltransferase [Nitrosomonas aestuarii]
MSYQQKKTQQKFAALVLAADRTTSDPITQHTGAACKAFAPVGGVPMIIRVLDALAASDLVDSILLCGPPRFLLSDCPPLMKRIESGKVSWLPNKDSPSRSAAHGINHLPADSPVLITTADHALLTPHIVHYFLTESVKAGHDATVGLVTQKQMTASFPGSKRTYFRLRDGGICGCNLFTFNPQGRTLVQFWRQVEDLRKQPWQLISQIVGPKIVLSYLFRRLSLAQALNALAAKSGVRAQGIMLPDARAGIDVDKIEDLLLAESILNKAPVPFYKRKKTL